MYVIWGIIISEWIYSFFEENTRESLKNIIKKKMLKIEIVYHLDHLDVIYDIDFFQQ